MKSAMLAGVFAAMALLNPSYAATSTCPTPEEIKQQALDNGGYRYEMRQPDGRTWLGENPQASASYLTDSTFHDARYTAEDHSVTCTYKGPMNNDASFSVTLKPVLNWNLIPKGDWRGTYCEALEIAKCSFTHQ
ncbi:DUF3757 domain-containing protein [Pseudomonas reactans]|uniref:DUF3757 domain-containing protein n=1 Tax=Pseudomonas reactans TaxID=117680 RepID=UPI0015A4885C|nr:DUF3757 domain-containing protein [Pseudomonas reactans]NWA66196.1 DUF3757 domain-containing protein [Pseudomonas reactans]